VLAVLPDATSAFAGARHAQEQRFDLAAGASLVALDALVAGRAARGERWAFERAATRLEVRVDGRLALCDALALGAPRGGALAPRLAPFEAFATAVALGPAFTEGARALVADLASRPVEPGAPLLASAAPLEGGVLLRAAAASPEALAAFLRAALAFTATALGDDPFARRW
jgi:urease accessory protein